MWVKISQTALGLNNLAELLRMQGEYATARPLYERALAIYEQVLGPQHPNVATLLNNLAGLLHNQGEYAAARPLYERALAIYEQVLGSEHTGPWTTSEQKVALRKSITNSIGRIPDWNAILVATETLQRLSETTD
jgi:tetratricopeptide (TPR) repeat protein